MSHPQDEQRAVVSNDPSFSQATNDRLTEELRETIGSDTVTVPADLPHRERERHATGGPALAALSNLWLLIAIIGIAVGVALLIAAANSGDWWVAALALLLDGAGLGVILHAVLGMIATPEKASPALAAEMEAEGDPDPDATVNELVDEYRGR